MLALHKKHHTLKKVDESYARQWCQRVEEAELYTD
jgi:hypothetical protein